jgi:hypothetical protein
VTGGFQFTHYTGWQGCVAARNALLPGAQEGLRSKIPWWSAPIPRSPFISDNKPPSMPLRPQATRRRRGLTHILCNWSR